MWSLITKLALPPIQRIIDMGYTLPIWAGLQIVLSYMSMQRNQSKLNMLLEPLLTKETRSEKTL